MHLDGRESLPHCGVSLNMENMCHVLLNCPQHSQAKRLIDGKCAAEKTTLENKMTFPIAWHSRELYGMCDLQVFEGLLQKKEIVSSFFFDEECISLSNRVFC